MLRQQLKELCEQDAQTMQGFFQLDHTGMWPKIIDIIRADVQGLELRIEELEQTSDPETKMALEGAEADIDMLRKQVKVLESDNQNLENDKEILLAKLNYNNDRT